jgi:hypothetical protein
MDRLAQKSNSLHGQYCNWLRARSSGSLITDHLYFTQGPKSSVDHTAWQTEYSTTEYSTTHDNKRTAWTKAYKDYSKHKRVTLLQHTAVLPDLFGPGQHVELEHANGVASISQFLDIINFDATRPRVQLMSAARLGFHSFSDLQLIIRDARAYA